MVVAMLCFCISAVAQSISLDMSNVTVKQAMNELKNKSGYSFVYSAGDLNTSQKISVKAENLKDAISQILTGQDVSYEIQGKNIVIRRSAVGSSDSDNSKTVRGTVYDSKGIPIAGANVIVVGHRLLGTVTDTEGKFVIKDVPENAELMISFLGFQDKVVRSEKGSIMNIELSDDTELLNEVVVVGYGKQKRLTMSSAVATVKGDKIEVPVSNISNELGGNIPGIITRQSSGEPGKDAASVLLRGNSPLVLVDGIERPWEKINQNDIESISVLKDAAAVAPYGLKGANGVILINTKRGKEGKISLTYDGSVGVQHPINIPDFLDAYNSLVFYNEALRMDGRDNEVYSDELLQKYKSGTDDRYKNTDWMSEYMKSSTTTRHNISLSGGSKTISAYASFGYLYQGDMMDSDLGYDRYNLRSNVDFHPLDITKVSFDINLTNDTQRKHYYDGKKMMEDLFRLCAPTVPNKVGGKPAMQGGGSSMYMGVHDGGDKKYKDNFQNVALSVEQQVPFLEGLTLKALFSYDRQINDAKEWIYPFTAYAYNEAGEIEAQQGGEQKPSLNIRNKQWINKTVQASIDYARTFGKHEVDLLGVYERRWGKTFETRAGRKNYDFLIPELNMGSPIAEYISNSGTSSRFANQGYVVRLNYNYAQKYMVELAGRYDQTYLYAPGNRSAFFPSISVGWRLSQENFMKNVRFINNLKLRASYGKSGNPVGDAFSYLSKYNIGNGAVFGKNPIQLQSLTEGAEPNSDLTWESVWKANLGLDFNLWNDLLYGEIDVYYDKRSDRILSPNAVVSAEYGIGLSKENAGKDERYGFDLAFGSHYTFAFGMSMSNTLTFGFTRDRQIEIRESPGTKNNPRKRRTGRPSGRTWGYKAAGLFKDQEDIDNWAFQQGALPGDIKYVDVNGDGKIDSEDQVVIGKNQTPELMWGYNLELGYRNMYLKMLIVGAGNSDYYLGSNGDRNVRYPFRDSIHPRKDHLDSWTESNPDPNAKYPRLSASIRNQNYETSSYWMVNTAYVRLKSLQIGYNFPQKLAKRMKMQNLRVYADFYNLWNIYSRMPKDFDVENQAFNSYPQQRVSSFGVSLTF